jgi:putative (di)nucleoside polyphosphate hydrolase
MGLPAQYFRAGVGAVIVNGQGLILALERADIPDAWQLPQGGLDAGEEPLPAARREVAEETGILPGDLQLLASCPEPLAYELPAGMRSARTGRGQVQYWFLFRFHGPDSVIDVGSGGEFRAWRWMEFEALLQAAKKFRRPLYHRLLEQFRPAMSGIAASVPDAKNTLRPGT